MRKPTNRPFHLVNLTLNGDLSNNLIDFDSF